MEDDKNNPSFYTLLTQFSTLIQNKKDMQSIAYEIREYVIKHKNIKNKEQTAKKLLDHFLHLQSKILIRSTEQWNNALQLSNKIGHALLRLTNFPIHHYYLFAFNKIKYLTLDLPATLNTQLCSTQYDQIQVQQDIKLKTRFFFKWCQYLKYIKKIKFNKIKNIQNKKISVNYNKYTINYKYFYLWKNIYKKYKNEKNKTQILQTYSNQRLTKNCFNIFNQIIQIIKFENYLSQRIQKKIINCKLKLVYDKLKNNKIIIKSKIKSKKMFNKYSYYFLSHFTQQLKPLFNKSYKNSRSSLLQHLNQQLISNTFTHIYKIYQHTKQKIKQAHHQIIINHFIKWKKYKLTSLHFFTKKNKFITFISSRRKKIVLTILNFQRMLNIQLINGTIINNDLSLPNKNLTCVNMKKIIKDKYNTLIKYLTNNQHQSLFNKLKYASQLNKIINTNNVKIVKTFFKRIIIRINFYQKIQSSKIIYYQSLNQRYHNRLCQIAFIKWKKIKFYQKYQQDKLSSIDKCCRKLVLLMFWSKFRCRITVKQHLTKFTSLINNILLKRAFKQIAKPSYFINQKIAIMKINKNRKIMINLFKLLVKNQSFNTEISTGINKYHISISQQILIKSLKQLYFCKKQSTKIITNIQKNQTIFFFHQLKSSTEESKLLFTNTQILTKKLCLKTLQKFNQYQIQTKQQDNRNIEQLYNKLNQISMIRLIYKLKQEQKLHNYYKTNQQQITKKLQKPNITKLKSYIKKVQHHTTLKLKQNKIIQNKKINTIKLLSLKYKINTIQSMIKKIKYQQTFKVIKSLFYSKKSVKKGCELLKVQLYQRNIKQFYKLLNYDRVKLNQLSTKMSQISKNNSKKNSKIALTMLKDNKQNIQNTKKISSTKKQTILTQFIAMSLQSKFHKLKFSFSLKSYAKNLLKKAFKSLKQPYNRIKQKQNISKLAKTSFTIVQKLGQKTFKSNTLSQQIQRFNLRKSRQIR